jgi:hypothetical protein
MEGIEASTTLSFQAFDVTGSFSADLTDIQAALPVSTVAATVATMMHLPENVPYALRDDFSSQYLDDSMPIGDAIEPGARLTITPKTHLG